MSDVGVSASVKPWAFRSGPAWLADCALLAAIGALFNFVALSHDSVWSDEIFSLKWSALDPAYLLGAGNHLETNPPAYYLLLKYWAAVFGTGPTAARAMSGLAAMLCVLVLYAIARRLGDRSLGLLSALFLASNPNFVALARQARGYTLLALLCGLALLGLVHSLRPSAGRRWPWLMLFAAASIGSFLIHYTAIVFIAACFIGVALHVLSGPERSEHRVWLGWGLVSLAVAIGIAPSFWTAATLARSANIEWIDPLAPAMIWSFFRELVLGRARPGLVSDVLAVGLTAVALAGLWRRRPSGVAWLVTIGIPTLFLVLLMSVSLFRPLFIARTGVWLTLPIAIAWAWFVLTQSSRWLRIGTAAVLLLVLGAASAKVLTRPSFEEWRDVARTVATDPSCNGPVVTIGPHNVAAAFYEPALAGRAQAWVRLRPGQPQTAESAINDRLTAATALEPAELKSFVQSHPGTALIYRHGVTTTAKGIIGDLADEMTVSLEFPGLHLFCR